LDEPYAQILAEIAALPSPVEIIDRDAWAAEFLGFVGVCPESCRDTVPAK